MKLKLVAAFAAVTCAVVSAGAGIVSDPYRAADVKWPRHELKGRSWRFLLNPEFFSLDGVKDEAFVQDAGIAYIHAPSTLHGERADKMFAFSDDPNAKRPSPRMSCRGSRTSRSSSTRRAAATWDSSTRSATSGSMTGS